MKDINDYDKFGWGEVRFNVGAIYGVVLGIVIGMVLLVAIASPTNQTKDCNCCPVHQSGENK